MIRNVLAVLAGRGLRALLRGGDRDRPGVVEQRGLHPEEHHREQDRQQDHQLDGRRAALTAQAAVTALTAPTAPTAGLLRPT